MNFEIPENMLDEIQANIESIIGSFDIPEDNKMDVIKKINFMYNQTKQLSLTDSLTGLFNRRHFENNFEREFLRAKRYNSPLSIAVIDIDNFKQINDTHGHSMGDYVIKEIAYILSSAIRTTDMVFRYGGEEFVAILTETSLESAMIPLERLRASIENHKFSYKGIEIKVTASIGVNANTSVGTVWEMFDLADKALYKAKEGGRNQIQSCTNF